MVIIELNDTTINSLRIIPFYWVIICWIVTCILWSYMTMRVFKTLDKNNFKWEYHWNIKMVKSPLSQHEYLIVPPLDNIMICVFTSKIIPFPWDSYLKKRGANFHFRKQAPQLVPVQIPWSLCPSGCSISSRLFQTLSSMSNALLSFSHWANPI